jgi:hypothetical protein
MEMMIVRCISSHIASFVQDGVEQFHDHAQTRDDDERRDDQEECNDNKCQHGHKLKHVTKKVLVDLGEHLEDFFLVLYLASDSCTFCSESNLSTPRRTSFEKSISGLTVFSASTISARAWIWSGRNLTFFPIFAAIISSDSSFIWMDLVDATALTIRKLRNQVPENVV